jgi:hypothetical protein
MNLRDDNECEVKIKNKNATAAFSLFLNELPYGGSCTYKVDQVWISPALCQQLQH